MKDFHVVGMTKYTVGDFSNSQTPTLILTCEVTSCVVILLKNLDEHKICHHFGLAHINYSNIYFEDNRQEAILAFLQAFQAAGGDLATASIQLLGGQENDPNKVIDKIQTALILIGNKLGYDLAVKQPRGCTLTCSLASRQAGNYQEMTIAVNSTGTYLRKETFKAGVSSHVEFKGDKADQWLSNENLRNIQQENASSSNALLQKTKTFFHELNIYLQPEFQETHRDQLYEMAQHIKRNAFIEKTEYRPTLQAQGIETITEDSKVEHNMHTESSDSLAPALDTPLSSMSVTTQQTEKKSLLKIGLTPQNVINQNN